MIARRPPGPAGGGLDVTANAAFIADVVRELVALGAEPTTHDADAFFKQRAND